jgi:quercetin dioxygenase-like cupin family protein
VRVTVFRREGDELVADVRDAPAFEPFADWEGQPLRGVRLDELAAGPPADLQVVEIARGGHFVMHSSPHLAFCQIVRGHGTLRLPDGRDLGYAAPELYVFEPHTLHEWHSVVEDTLLSVCIVHLTGGLQTSGEG